MRTDEGTAWAIAYLTVSRFGESHHALGLAYRAAREYLAMLDDGRFEIPTPDQLAAR